MFEGKSLLTVLVTWGECAWGGGVAEVRPADAAHVEPSCPECSWVAAAWLFHLPYLSAMFVSAPFSSGNPRRCGQPCPDKAIRQPAGSFHLDTVIFLPGVPHPQICSSSPATNTFLSFSPTFAEHLLCSRHLSKHWRFSRKPNRQNLCPRGSHILVRETHKTPRRDIMKDKEGTKCDGGREGAGD